MGWLVITAAFAIVGFVVWRPSKRTLRDWIESILAGAVAGGFVCFLTMPQLAVDYSYQVFYVGRAAQPDDNEFNQLARMIHPFILDLGVQRQRFSTNFWQYSYPPSSYASPHVNLIAATNGGLIMSIIGGGPKYAARAAERIDKKAGRKLMGVRDIVWQRVTFEEARERFRELQSWEWNQRLLLE